MTGPELEQRNIAKWVRTSDGNTRPYFKNSPRCTYTGKNFLSCSEPATNGSIVFNRAAPGFFRMLQDQQFETNMLHLARLTDPPRSAEPHGIQLAFASQRSSVEAAR